MTESRFKKVRTNDHDETKDEYIYDYNDIQLSDDSDSSDDDENTKKNCLQKCGNLPLCVYCRRWYCKQCCFWCKRKKAFDSLLDDTKTENRNKTTTEKAEEALVYEECLDATSSKLVENSGWVNATMFSLALKTTIYIDFANSSDEQDICKNAWIYFTVIFLLSITSLFIPKLCCKKTESLRQELKLKKEEKLY